MNHLKDISELRGLSGQILFAMDSENVPGHCLCHFLRLETIAFKDHEEFKATSVMALHPDSDARLAHLANCFTGGQREAMIVVLKALVMTTKSFETVLENPVQAPAALKAFQEICKVNHTIVNKYFGT
jgi:hypothetical protein